MQTEGDDALQERLGNDNDRVREFYNEAAAVFENAARAAGGAVETTYSLAEFPIRLRFAGPRLVSSITPAFAHLAVETRRPSALTVSIWDSVSTGTEMPPPPWSLDDYASRGAIRGFGDDRIQVAFGLGSCTLSMLDARLGRGLFWTRDASVLPPFVCASPLLLILYWYMRGKGVQIIHAAAVGSDRGGAVLVGRSGSGKSTTALACLASGLLYGGDDYVLLAEGQKSFVHGIYNSAKIDVGMADRMPHLRKALERASAWDNGKAFAFLYEHFPEQTVSGFPLEAILVPRIAGLPATRLFRISPAEALKSLAPSTLFQLSGTGPEDFQRMGRWVTRIPCYALELSNDPAEISRAIARFLGER